MKRKIALLSDIHGNTTALEAVLADAKKEQVTITGFWEICWHRERVEGRFLT